MNVSKYGLFLLSLLTMSSQHVLAGGKLIEDLGKTLSQPRPKFTRQEAEGHVFVHNNRKNYYRANRIQARVILSDAEKKLALQAYDSFLDDMIRNGLIQDNVDFVNKYYEAIQKEPVTTVRRLPEHEIRRLDDWNLPTEQQLNKSSSTARFKHPFAAAVFRQTVEQIAQNQNLLKSVRNSLHASKIVECDLKGTIESRNFTPLTTVLVKDEDVLQTIKDTFIRRKHPIVLNFAARHDSGGGAAMGCFSQEEDLGRTSTLAYILQAMALMGSYPLPELGGILNPDIAFFRDGKYKRYAPFLNPQNGQLMSVDASVISLAAYNADLRNPKRDAPLNAQGSIDNRNLIEKTAQKIIALFQMVEYEAQRYGSQNIILILGAWGCGVFNNDANVISGLFHEYLKQYGGIASEVIFSVKGITTNTKLLPFFRLNGQTYKKTTATCPTMINWQTNWSLVLPKVTQAPSQNGLFMKSEEEEEEEGFSSTNAKFGLLDKRLMRQEKGYAYIWRVAIPQSLINIHPAQYAMWEGGTKLFHLQNASQPFKDKLLEMNTTFGHYCVDKDDIVFSSTDGSNPSINEKGYSLCLKEEKEKKKSHFSKFSNDSSQEFVQPPGLVEVPTLMYSGNGGGVSLSFSNGYAPQPALSQQNGYQSLSSSQAFSYHTSAGCQQQNFIPSYAPPSAGAPPIVSVRGQVNLPIYGYTGNQVMTQQGGMNASLPAQSGGYMVQPSIPQQWNNLNTSIQTSYYGGGTVQQLQLQQQPQSNYIMVPNQGYNPSQQYGGFVQQPVSAGPPPQLQPQQLNRSVQNIFTSNSYGY